MRQWLALILLALTSCSSPMRHLAVESVEQGDRQVVVALANYSDQDITIESGAMRCYIKGDSLISFLLEEQATIPANGSARCEWEVEKHDPATLYAMSRRPVESYISRLTFDISVEGQGFKSIEKRGVGGKAMLKRFGNIENLLQ